VLDTEILFALDPKDPHHKRAVKLLASRSDVVAPDTALLEFAIVLRTMGVRPRTVRDFVLALDQDLARREVTQARTIDGLLLATQCQLESAQGLSYFDSLVAASALSLDRRIVSDDEAFDRVPGLERIPLG